MNTEIYIEREKGKEMNEIKTMCSSSQLTVPPKEFLLI